jgi:hypothetical protein
VEAVTTLDSNYSTYASNSNRDYSNSRDAIIGGNASKKESLATVPATAGKQSTVRIKQQQDSRDTNSNKSPAIAGSTAVAKTIQRSDVFKSKAPATGANHCFALER